MLTNRRRQPRTKKGELRAQAGGHVLDAAHHGRGQAAHPPHRRRAQHLRAPPPVRLRLPCLLASISLSLFPCPLFVVRRRTPIDMHACIRMPPTTPRPPNPQITPIHAYTCLQRDSDPLTLKPQSTHHQQGLRPLHPRPRARQAGAPPRALLRRRKECLQQGPSFRRSIRFTSYVGGAPS